MRDRVIRANRMLTNTSLAGAEAAISPGAEMEHPRRSHTSQDRAADLQGGVQRKPPGNLPSGVLGAATLPQMLRRRCLRAPEGVGTLLKLGQSCSPCSAVTFPRECEQGNCSWGYAERWSSPGKFPAGGGCREADASETPIMDTAIMSSEGRGLGRSRGQGALAAGHLALLKKSHTLQKPKQLSPAVQAERTLPPPGPLSRESNAGPVGRGERRAEFSPVIAEQGGKGGSGDVRS